jgi:dihydroorotate dehydrogenase (fumarate)
LDLVYHIDTHGDRLKNFEYSVAGVELSSPLINGAGSINGTHTERILREIDFLAGTGIGAITAGTFTIPFQIGNEAKYGSPTYYYDPIEKKTYNSEGFPNIGLANAIALAPEIVRRAHEKGKPVIYSCSATVSPKDGSAVEQSRRLVYELLETDVDLIELNVSCPNLFTEGSKRKPIMGYDLESISELLDVLSDEIGEDQRVGIKPPPYISDEEKLLIPEIAKLLKAKKVFKFMVASNTIPNRGDKHPDGRHFLSVPDGLGGMSGPDTKDEGRDQLLLWKVAMGDSIDIISALGVDSGKEVQVRRSLGAAAAAGVTFLRESGNWAAKISDVLHDYVDAMAEAE